eukprot:2145811-Prymnesium_polylepis.1
MIRLHIYWTPLTRADAATVTRVDDTEGDTGSAALGPRERTLLERCLGPREHSVSLIRDVDAALAPKKGVYVCRQGAAMSCGCAAHVLSALCRILKSVPSCCCFSRKGSPRRAVQLHLCCIGARRL